MFSQFEIDEHYLDVIAVFCWLLLSLEKLSLQGHVVVNACWTFDKIHVVILRYMYFYLFKLCVTFNIIFNFFNNGLFLILGYLKFFLLNRTEKGFLFPLMVFHSSKHSCVSCLPFFKQYQICWHWKSTLTCFNVIFSRLQGILLVL